MTVFNGTLYFSTYAAPPAGTTVVHRGHRAPLGTRLRHAGRHDLHDQPHRAATGRSAVWPRCSRHRPTSAEPSPRLYVEPDLYDPTLAGKVIPGVSIKATPACANLGNPGPDSYVYGASHSSPQNYAAGSYSLFTQVGAKGTNGATTRQFETAVPTPVSPTLIDSWAAVLE